jgi:hypothetical protein
VSGIIIGMTPARRGSLMAATWLIGLGLVFLVRELADLGWAEAWPLFVILAGVASIISRIVRGGFGLLAAPWALTGPIAWTIVGVILLASTTGNLGQGPIELIDEWWPWLAIGFGIWFLVGAVVSAGPDPTETLALPLDGASEASVTIRFGAGSLSTRAATAGHLVDGSFEGGVTFRRNGPGRVELAQDTSHGWPGLERRHDWTVGLTSEVPLDLRIDAGASRNVFDLRDLRVRSVELHTGASDTRMLLPRAAGATSVRAATGADSLTLEVPTGVAARIRTRVVLGSVQIDETRFPKSTGGYESPDYATAENRVDIDVQSGLASLKVISAS